VRTPARPAAAYRWDPPNRHDHPPISRLMTN
jgi:hypothetical protein